MSRTPLLIATANKHKLREFTDLLSDVPGLEMVSLRDYPALVMPPEDGPTMRDNARIKAEYCAQATGLPALADDSGIEVAALGGAPGVHSARWVAGSDADRTNALLARLDGLPPEQRGARYRCALCVARVVTLAQLEVIETEATCEGSLTTNWRGENGFGYDPIFEITAATGTRAEWVGSTMAEAPPEVKAQVSHRSRALAALQPQLLSFLNR